jgi:hypothetical protein
VYAATLRGLFFVSVFQNARRSMTAGKFMIHAASFGA